LKKKTLQGEERLRGEEGLIHAESFTSTGKENVDLKGRKRVQGGSVFPGLCSWRKS